MNRFVFIYRTTKVRLKSRNAQNCHTPPLCFLQENIGEVARSAGGVKKRYVLHTYYNPIARTGYLLLITYEDNATN